MWKAAAIVVGALAGGYAALALYAFFFSDRALFHPERSSFHAPDGMLRLPAGGGQTLAAWYLANPSAKYTLMYFHGNAEDLGAVEPLLRELSQHGFAVFAIEYPGYGYSSGVPSEAAIYRATAIGLNYLRDQVGVKESAIVAFGRSLGGGPAVELAAQHRIGGLILQSTFVSAFRVVTGWPILPFDKFENLKKMPRVRCPVLVMQGDDDRIVPFSHGEQLYAAAAEPKQKLWVSGAGHNDFQECAGEAFWAALEKFRRSLN